MNFIDFFKTFRYIETHDEITTKELAKAMDITFITARSRLNRLVYEGYLRKTLVPGKHGRKNIFKKVEQ